MLTRAECEQIRAKWFGEPKPFISAEQIEATRRARCQAQSAKAPQLAGPALKAAVDAATPAHVPPKVLTGNEAYFASLEQQGIL